MTMKANRITKLLSAAKRGDAAAQFELANRYRQGDGVPRNFAESLRWYREAAELKHSDAMNDLGTMLLNGVGCEADPVGALKWYELAAKTGHTVACYNLAKRYLHGDGVRIDHEKAFHWFSEAARQFDTEAMCELGTMFRFGQGTERNLIAAAEFHLLAAKDGDVVAMGNISNYVDELQDIALVGDTIASRCLMEIYNLGLGVEKSMPLTWTWTKWAKEHCPPSDDAEEAAWIEDAYVFYKKCLSTDDREQGERVLKALIAARGRPSAPGKSPGKRKLVKA